MRLDIDNVIYSYLFICVMLLIYNILYIFYSNRQEKKYDKRQKSWQKSIMGQVTLISEGNSIETNHKNHLEKQLIKTNQLIPYVRALNTLREQGEKLEPYLVENYIVIQSLAYGYRKKDNMDKAFFAFFISKNPPCRGHEYRPIMEILLSYLEDSTVYCRENVLNALNILGNSQAIENAFQILNDRRLFHHQKLLADGLVMFTGDKEELAERLWHHLEDWDVNLMLSVVKFITISSDKFKERFFEVVQSSDIDLEIRLATLRYFRNHVYEPIRPLLLSYLRDRSGVDENMSILAASLLETYPGEDTINALKIALSHSNWYVRYNAATSLINLEVDTIQLQDILEGNDQYAKEILNYMMEHRKVGYSL